MIPNLSKHVQDAQTIQKYHNDQHARNCSFVAGDRVLVRNYSGSPNWLPGTVKTVLGPVSYQVEFKDGHQIDKDHTDKDIIEFPLVTTTSNSTTVEASPVRRSSRVRRPPDRLTM